MTDAPFRPTVGTLAYLWDRERDLVLMVHRNARPGDDHLGKYNGLGGKVERDEDVVASLRRELDEEAGVHLDRIVLRGTVSWSGFGPRGEDWLGFVFLVDAWTGEPPPSNDEGTLEWIARERIERACAEEPAVRAGAELPLWAGDRFFLPLVFDDDPRPFHGTMPYDGDRPLDWSYERL
jgi:8-oxo-dGTP diphosphatase